jgi:putative polyketide hydroxylase
VVLTDKRSTPSGLSRALVISTRGMDTSALRPQIERLSTFTFAAQLAERYAQGRCFLVGDAAHRATPRGGIGMNTAIQGAFDLGWKLAWVLRGWASTELLATYERERRPVAAHNVRRSSEPLGARRDTAEELPWDLGGRLPHHWLPVGDQERSTVDLIGDGLTLLAGPSDPRWLRFATYIQPNAPLNVHVIDAHTSQALGLQPTGALLARPDGRELGRWTSADTAMAAAAESSVLPAVLAAQTTVSTNSSRASGTQPKTRGAALRKRWLRRHSHGRTQRKGSSHDREWTAACRHRLGRWAL